MGRSARRSRTRGHTTMATWRCGWASVLLALGLPALAAAEEVTWRAARSPLPAVGASSPNAPPARAPAASIGAPVPIARATAVAAAQPAAQPEPWLALRTGP